MITPTTPPRWRRRWLPPGGGRGAGSGLSSSPTSSPARSLCTTSSGLRSPWPTGSWSPTCSLPREVPIPGVTGELVAAAARRSVPVTVDYLPHPRRPCRLHRLRGRAGRRGAHHGGGRHHLSARRADPAPRRPVGPMTGPIDTLVAAGRARPHVQLAHLTHGTSSVVRPAGWSRQPPRRRSSPREPPPLPPASSCSSWGEGPTW